MRASEHYPWLKHLPRHRDDGLDHTEFAIPNLSLELLRKDLEQDTGHLIMIYRIRPPQPSSGRLSLCARIEPATLTTAQAALLRDAETIAAAHEACLVAYHNPLSLRQQQPPHDNENLVALWRC